MALNYPHLALVAQKLIDKNGQPVVFTRLGRDPANVNKPWRGPNTGENVVVNCIAVIIPNDEVDDKEAMKRGDATAYVAALDFGVNLLEGFDEVVDSDNRTWRVLNVDIIKPGPVRVLYTAQLNH